MAKIHNFRAVIEAGPGGGAFVRIPFDVEQEFGRKRVPIKALINGEPYRGTLVRMGEPCHVLGILKEIRQKIGKDIGSELAITLEEDTEARNIEIPGDLQQALERTPGAKENFEKLSYTHRREYVRSILEAKQVVTRVKRVERTIAMLMEKKGK